MWNWQQADWPNFKYNATELDKLEATFLKNSGMLISAFKYLDVDDKNLITVELISKEAIKTSEIEGEYLDRQSVRSSICKHFGLPAKNYKALPAEQGIVELMMNLYKSFNALLNNEQLFRWHAMLFKDNYNNLNIKNIGNYRTHNDTMQVISGPIHKPKVHFEAIPSRNVKNEMKHFIKWFNDTMPDNKNSLPTLTRAGITHLYFVSIHPFEDGNGRIARAITEKVLAQGLGKPTLIALSYVIEKNKKVYYDELEKANKHNEITRWLCYFGQTIIDAQTYTLQQVDFIIVKAKFYNNFRDKFNDRQSRVIEKMFCAGPEGFEGGLSADHYIKITKTTRATATRDLQDLVEKGGLVSRGKLKYTRYYLKIDEHNI